MEMIMTLEEALERIAELEKEKDELVEDWIRKKQKNTYVRINEDWRDCDFQYPGWIKE